MKRLSVILILLATALGLSAAPRYDIVPAPKNLIPADGQFVLGPRTRLEAGDAAFEEIAADFRSQILSSTGYSLNGNGDRILLRRVSGLGKEAYRMDVTPDGVTIEASEVNGAFYGLQTLLQLFPA